MREMRAAYRLALVRVIVGAKEPVDMLAVWNRSHMIVDVAQVGSYLSMLEMKKLIDVVDQNGPGGVNRYAANEGTVALEKLLEKEASEKWK